jgi:DNA-binding response OmpR family regulator
MARILIVEDDLDINNMLNTLLMKNGHEPYAAYSGSEAALLLQAERLAEKPFAGERFDLILLDLMLPGRSGLEVLGELRAAGDDTPVIMLTAVTDKETVVNLLTAGANDYLTKPFDNAELLARVRVQLRSAAADIIRHKDLVLDVEAFDALIGGHFVGLSKTEFNILRLLMSNPRKVFTKDNLYESVWGGRFMGGDNTINVHISKLRTKLAALAPATEYIVTVWGIGFKMA